MNLGIFICIYVMVLFSFFLFNDVHKESKSIGERVAVLEVKVAILLEERGKQWD